ncbi:hypothetical protein QQF64_029584 [Cirrhinus molitorella]|uniref:Uncharacterized protein n=1 Tax=Cirrhinus molitorella TaxID=172907 RepID=A0ABR3N105_9TELE
MSAPDKRTQWDEDLTQFRKEHGLSKKVLLNCCLVRRIFSWASPNKKAQETAGPFIVSGAAVSVQPQMDKLNGFIWLLQHWLVSE